jgi:hypothetical protein
MDEPRTPAAYARPAAPFADERELAALIAAFDQAAIPGAAWTHAAHLTVGAWHVERLGLEGAMTHLREGIRRLNTANGIVNSEHGGYHETVTWLYLAVIAELLTAMPAGMAVHQRVAAIIAGPVDALVRRHYSAALLWSPLARRQVVAPDLLPLPMTAGVRPAPDPRGEPAARSPAFGSPAAGDGMP